jgi:hypothetical protein
MILRLRNENKQTKKTKNTGILLRKELPYSAKSRTARKRTLAKILVRAIKPATAVNLQTKNRATADSSARAV